MKVSLDTGKGWPASFEPRIHTREMARREDIPVDRDYGFNPYCSKSFSTRVALYGQYLRVLDTRLMGVERFDQSMAEARPLAWA